MTKKKKESEKLIAGAPTKFQEVFCEQVEKLCRLGAIDKEVADFFGVCEATINNWKIVYPQFLESIKKGKMISDANVADSLYKRALGYEHKEDKIFQYEGSPVIVPTIKHYAPDSVAAIFWLKNRRPDLWKDKHEISGLPENKLIITREVINGKSQD
jgi:hypothetical protein